MKRQYSIQLDRSVKTQKHLNYRQLQLIISLGTWNPSTVNTSTTGKTTYIFTPAAGECATTTTLDITITPTVFSTTGVTICSNQLPYSWNDNNYSAEGVYEVELVSNLSGCDSIATLNLSVVTSLTPTFITN